jgi:uncharacterized membrane protein SirB2
MADIEVRYLHLESVHIGLMLVSVGLFALRRALVLAGKGWVMAKPWWMLSDGIDTVLLTAGVTLWTLLSLSSITSPWLWSRLLLVL